MKIDIRAQHYKLTIEAPAERWYVKGMLDHLTQKNFAGREVVTKTYIPTNAVIPEYRPPIGTLGRFKTHLDNLRAKPPTLTYTPPSEGEDIDVNVREGWELREEQLLSYDYLLDNTYNMKLVELQTGKGKTFITLAACAKIRKRTLMFLKASYIEKWATTDIPKILDVSSKDILCVQGSGQLAALGAMCAEGTLTAKFILISNRTFLNYISEYEANPVETVETYTYAPDDFILKLNAGVAVIDEIHQDFFGVCKILGYMNIKKFIGLSATLFSDDPHLKKMYALIFPEEMRNKAIAYDKYIDVYACGYNITSLNKVRTSEHNSNNYSHIAFEKSIMKNIVLRKQYYEMINDYIKELYLKDYKPGNKIAVFCASVAMCSSLVEHLRPKYPNFKINRYAESDPMSNILESDISVTTILSGGTAIDIPGLTVALLTINILSQQANVQTVGRLRKIAGIDVKFGYLYCLNIRKHISYHERRMEILADKTRKIMFLNYNRSLYNG